MNIHHSSFQIEAWEGEAWAPREGKSSMNLAAAVSRNPRAGDGKRVIEYEAPHRCPPPMELQQALARYKQAGEGKVSLRAQPRPAHRGHQPLALGDALLAGADDSQKE